MTAEEIAVTIHYMRIRVVIVNTESCAKLLSKPEAFCSAARLEWAASVNNAQAKLRGYAAELALSFALSGDAMLPPVYSRDERNKPVISDGFISLSHSGRFAAAAYSPSPVGIDIEELRPVPERLSKRILCPAEQKAFLLGSDEHFLLRRFTEKEAYYKLTGEGVSGGLRRVYAAEGRVFRDGVMRGFCTRLDGPDRACCLVTRGEPGLIDTVVL